MPEEPEYDPTPVPVDTAPEHLEAIATTEAVLELPPEKSGFGEGNVGEVLLEIEGLSKSFGSRAGQPGHQPSTCDAVRSSRCSARTARESPPWSTRSSASSPPTPAR